MTAPAQETLLRDLFGEPSPPPVPGLRYVPDWIDAGHERRLLAAIDAQPWRTTITRRTQHYGYSYEPGGSRAQRPRLLGDLPPWIRDLAERALAQGLFERLPDNSVINEYLPGQGISPHLDLPAFGPTVASLSLGSDCVLDLISADGATKHALLLERRSLLVLSGPSRAQWRHGIAPRRTDRYRGVAITRERRVSVTLRTTLVR